MSRCQRLPNGSIDAHDDGSRVSELQELLDRTNKELSQSREHSAALGVRLAELEAELANARRELSRSEELSIKQQREQREVRGKQQRRLAHRDVTNILQMKRKSTSSRCCLSTMTTLMSRAPKPSWSATLDPEGAS